MTLILLFGPKVLSLLHLFARPKEIASFGGPVRVLLSAVLETLFSILTAPVLVWFHTRFVLRNIGGQTVTWHTQTRDGGAGPRWIEIIREYWPLPIRRSWAWRVGVVDRPQLFGLALSDAHWAVAGNSGRQAERSHGSVSLTYF